MKKDERHTGKNRFSAGRPVLFFLDGISSIFVDGVSRGKFPDLSKEKGDDADKPGSEGW
jgi:hypothetical protein